jgi:hypothetical protein
MNKRSLQARGVDLSSRQAVEDAIDSAKQDRDLTWEEAAKRVTRKIPKWGRRESNNKLDEKATARRDRESAPAADENWGLRGSEKRAFWPPRARLWGLRGSEKRAFWPPRARLVAPTPSMRFVSAHFGAQTGRCRGRCQLKTSQQQASQRLRHHFVAVQAFAFACPKVPGRVGPFLRSPFLFMRNAAKLPLFH